MAKDLDMYAGILAGVGAINWGLVQFMDFNLVTKIFEYIPFEMGPAIVYGAVAVSGVLVLNKAFK